MGALISLQVVSTLSLYVALLINMGQETSLGMITKTFVALMLLTNIDNMFVNVLPQSIIENGSLLNAADKLIMTIDYNTTSRLLKRLSLEENRSKPSWYFRTL